MEVQELRLKVPGTKNTYKREKHPVIVVSSKAQIDSFMAYHNDTRKKYTMIALDGTYGIMRGGGVLVSVGTVIGYRDKDEKYRRRFIPWLHLWARTENGTAVGILLSELRSLPRKYGCNEDFIPDFALMDQGWGLRKGTEKVFGLAAKKKGTISAFGDAVKILICWVHVRRLIEEVVGSEFCQVAAENAGLFHRCVTKSMAILGMDLVTKSWDEAGQSDAATWLRKHHAGDPWGNWFLGASSRNQIIPNQNPNEVGIIVTLEGGTLKRCHYIFDFLCDSRPGFDR